MRRDGTATRDALIRAGERLFAERGVEVPLVEIQRAAGQRNNSALNYYFGSRDGLLIAILQRHLHVIEDERSLLLQSFGRGGRGHDLITLVDALVTPVAGQLRTPEGRDYLLIVPQVVHRLGVRHGSGQTPPALAYTLDAIRHALPASSHEARERTAVVTSMLAAALADRSHQINANDTLMLDDHDFVRLLIAMLCGALVGDDAAGLTGTVPAPRRSPSVASRTPADL